MHICFNKYVRLNRINTLTHIATQAYKIITHLETKLHCCYRTLYLTSMPQASFCFMVMFGSTTATLMEMEQIRGGNGKGIDNCLPCLVGHLTLLDASAIRYHRQSDVKGSPKAQNYSLASVCALCMKQTKKIKQTNNARIGSHQKN